MSETVEIKVNLSSKTWGDRAPGTRVYVNDMLIFDQLIVDPVEVNWTGELDDGNHSIVVEMYNKKQGDTETDSDGNILNDVLLNIDNIAIDNIDLDQLLWSKSIYYPADEYASATIEQCVNLGWNGLWKLEFSSPVYLWFLENL